MEDFIKKIDLSKAEKMAVVIFNDDGTTECGYFNMDLKDKAQAKHEIEIDIIDGVIQANKDRYFGGKKMNEKKLTDEEIIEALEICTDKTCKKCTYFGDGKTIQCIDRLLKDTLYLINRQKAEIERLKIDLENERNWGKIQTKQAVKDTAKEILTEIDDLTLCIIDGSNEFEKGYFQAIMDMKTAIKDLIKEHYGVEVK